MFNTESTPLVTVLETVNDEVLFTSDISQEFVYALLVDSDITVDARWSWVSFVNDYSVVSNFTVKL